jgi:hypothetical protein
LLVNQKILQKKGLDLFNSIKKKGSQKCEPLKKVFKNI